MRQNFSLLLILCSLTSFGASLPPTQGTKSMVVSSQHLATKIGVDILKRGGNAIDAAVAIGYAQAVVHPCCGNLGGGGFMLIRFANGQSTFINFREKAPAAATPSRFTSEDGSTLELSAGYHTGFMSHAYKSVGVPGTVMGLNYALKKYGTLTQQQVLQPAIDAANKGYTLAPDDVRILNYATTYFSDQPNLASVFLKNGRRLEPGDKLVQKNLGNTLSLIAKEGDAAFYRGSIAKKIVNASNKAKGLMTEKDFINYNVQETAPLKCHYRGYDILTSPPPSGGGIIICEMLAILEKYPLSTFGFRSAIGSHYIIEAMRFAYADRNLQIGDPDFVNNPLEKLLSKQHIQAIQSQIKDTVANKSIDIKAAGASPEGENTTAYTVLDKFGNCVSVTYTINSYFGARVMAEDTGFFLNNQLDDFTLKLGKANAYGLVQGNANLVAPNKRPVSSMAPTIVSKNGKLYLAIGTPGGSTIPTQIALAIQNKIDYGLNLQEAVDANRFHMQWLPDLVYMEPRTFSPDTLKILTNMGHHFKQGSPYGSRYWGAITAISADPLTNIITGASDPRRPAALALGE